MGGGESKRSKCFNVLFSTGMFSVCSGSHIGHLCHCFRQMFGLNISTIFPPVCHRKLTVAVNRSDTHHAHLFLLLKVFTLVNSHACCLSVLL